MLNPPNDRSCEIIAETALIAIDFGFCFRCLYGQVDYDMDSVYTKHSLFVERLRNCIVALSLNKKLDIVVDEDGCGIFKWL